MSLSNQPARNVVALVSIPNCDLQFPAWLKLIAFGTETVSALPALTSDQSTVISCAD